MSNILIGEKSQHLIFSHGNTTVIVSMCLSGAEARTTMTSLFCAHARPWCTQPWKKHKYHFNSSSQGGNIISLFAFLLTVALFPLNTFLKSQICTQTLAPRKRHKNFWNQNQMPPFKHPYKILYFIFYFFHQIFVLSEIQTNLSKHVPNFLPFEIWTFDLKNPKIQNFTLSFLVHYPQLKYNQKIQKIPNWSSSWPWNWCTHTFGWCCLQVISLGHPV